MRFFWTFGVAIALFGCSPDAFAQESAPVAGQDERQTEAESSPSETDAPRVESPRDEPPEDTITGEIVSGEDGLDLDGVPADERIEQALRDVLDATERFFGLGVRVREGVVFLSGESADEASIELATDIAQRTDGVAAVVNNITTRAAPLWSLGPAKRELRSLVREAISSLPLIAIGLVVLAVAVLFAGALGRGIGSFLGRRTQSELLRGVLQKAVSFAVLVIGVYLALRLTGLTRVAVTVISGTGLIGLALGFAFRDIAENFLASLLLSVQRPFRIGDVVEVDGHTGVVRKVTSRGTLLIDFDGNHIQISNSTVYKNTIKNFTANPKMRITYAVGIGFDDRIAEAQEIARKVLVEHPAVLDDPEPLVLVDNLGSATVNLKVYFWIDGATHSLLKMKSSVIRLTVRALADADISMPDEAREVVFPDGVPVRMLNGSASHEAGLSAERVPTTASERRGSPDPDAGAVAVEAEGDLESERASLERQADASRDPEEGANVLV